VAAGQLRDGIGGRRGSNIEPQRVNSIGMMVRPLCSRKIGIFQSPRPGADGSAGDSRGGRDAEQQSRDFSLDRFFPYC
jgi:hypothetical protein